MSKKVPYCFLYCLLFWRFTWQTHQFSRNNYIHHRS
uniref:Uncharacterized protein n=1 Tax=Setaria viridis TaxID=4556 RepID=A0A4V6D8V4_SETVI|nr:hypothetical protein SEVIR_4G286401v2 [Setaria viridis]